MYRIFKKKIYYLLTRLFYKFGHKYEPEFNTTLKNIQIEQCTLFDLQGPFNIDQSKFKKNHLITVLDRKDKYLNINKYIFESWVKNTYYTYSDNLDNLFTHKKKILKSFLQTPNRSYKKKIFYFHTIIIKQDIL